VADNKQEILKSKKGASESPFFSFTKMRNYFIFAIISLFYSLSLPAKANIKSEIDSLTNIIISPHSADTSKASALLSLGETIYMPTFLHKLR